MKKELNRFNSPLTPHLTDEKVILTKEEKKRGKKILDDWIDQCMAQE